MILANGVGAALFLLIVDNVISEQERVTALQAQKTLRIANQTLRSLRKGMNNARLRLCCNFLPRTQAERNRPKPIKRISWPMSGLPTIIIKKAALIQTVRKRKRYQSGKLSVVNEGTIHCENKKCPLGAAVIAPLIRRGETIGTLKLYYPSEKESNCINIELISGLSSLLSNQLEIAETDRAYHLAKEAEINALQAQISPHFLFNSMNIIVSLIRTDPEQARKLLTSLSYFLRQNVTGTTATKVSLNRNFHMLNHI